MSSANDLFTQINNAVLDLQAAQYQTYERPLKVLARLLRHESLEAANRTLIDGVDFDAFVASSERTGGSMAGSHKLAWPDDPRHVLGLTLILVRRLAEDPGYAISFCQHYFAAGSISAGIHAFTRQTLIPFVRDYKAYVLSQGKVEAKLIGPKSLRIFIVHGHDGEAREAVARFLGNIGFTPIILHEQANRGRTVIEKVEADGDVGFAVVLLTPDDVGRQKGAELLEPRARQNVLLELGYFLGRLGRGNVCALKKGTVEIPSDFAGVVWEVMDGAGGWKQALGRELAAAGYTIDWNLVMGS